MFFFKKKPIENQPKAAHPEDKLFAQAVERLRQYEALPQGPEKERQWEQLRQYVKTLPQPLQNRMVYEQARLRCTRSTSGFHGGGGGGLIHACGWADYTSFRWGNQWDDQGVAFRIHRECFPEGPVRLYYLDDDNLGLRDEGTLLELIRQHSSGISNVHIEHRVCQGWDDRDPPQEWKLIVFDLDENAFHHTVVLEGKHVPTKELGGYVFVLPRAGEFYCVLGEIREDVPIPLHKDDFCMK